MSRHDLERLAAESKAAKKPRQKPAPTTDDHESDDLRSAVGNTGMGQLLDPSVTTTIEGELGGGKPLAKTSGARRSRAGSTAEVRVHDDGTAAQLSREMGAVAFTFGRDIFLAGDAPALESSDGQAMLRHELTHVDQQAESGTTRPKRVSDPGSPAERQAAHAQTGTAPSTPSAVHRQEMPEEEEAMQMPADSVHRQAEEEEEMMMPMRADTVHRQEMPEEEEAMQMPADTVHRQEELPEEELAMMPADTVHRQEEEEGEEAVMPMRADTVHRQEELPEEELAMMPADTVHRQEEQEEDIYEPANPALAALFQATVIDKYQASIAALQADPPEALTAALALQDGTAALRSLGGVYETRDEMLHHRILRIRNAFAKYIETLRPHVDGPLSLPTIEAAMSGSNLNQQMPQVRDLLH